MTSLILAGPALAQAPSNEELFRALQALKAEVRQLRDQGGRDRRDAEQARAEVRALRAGRVAPLSSSRSPQQTAGAAVAAETPQSAAASGLSPYVGAAFGAGTLSGSDRGQATIASRNVQPGLSFTFDSRSTFSGRSDGEPQGSISLLAGARYRLAPSFLIGGQIDGTLNQATSRLTGTVVSPPGRSSAGGVPAAPSGTTTVGDRSISLSPQWSGSAVATAGMDVTDRVLVYALGGLTYTRFQVQDSGEQRGRDAFGPTVGGGAEYKIAPGWALMAEYRYTNYDRISNTQRGSSSSTGGGVASANTMIQTDKIRADSHLGRIGVLYSFD